MKETTQQLLGVVDILLINEKIDIAAGRAYQNCSV